MAKAKSHNKNAVVGVELPECPVCFEVMTAPIFQCQSGHSLCSTCTKNLTPPKCPICRQDMTQIRNWQLEDLLSKAKVPCPNKNDGCVFTMAQADLEDHVKECIFRLMQCPFGLVFGRCSWSGKLKDMMEHFKQSHPQNCSINMDTQVDIDNISISSDDRLMYVTFLGKYIFLLTIKIDTNQNLVYLVAQHIGSKNAAKQYNYEIRVISKQDSRRQISFTDYCYSDSFDVNEIFRLSKCGVMPLHMLNHFIKDKKISIVYSMRHQSMFKSNAKQDNVNTSTEQAPNKQNDNVGNNRYRSPAPKLKPNSNPQFKPRTGSAGPRFKGPKQHNKPNQN